MWKRISLIQKFDCTLSIHHPCFVAVRWKSTHRWQTGEIWQQTSTLVTSAPHSGSHICGIGWWSQPLCLSDLGWLTCATVASSPWEPLPSSAGGAWLQGQGRQWESQLWTRCRHPKPDFCLPSVSWYWYEMLPRSCNWRCPWWWRGR